MNTFAYRDLKDSWGKEFTVFKRAIGKATGKRKITVISNRAQPCDDDNFRGGMKPIFDALQDVELLINDNPVYLEHGNHLQIAGPEPYKTVFIIEDI